MKVLVTTDGSPHSLRALAHASHLARALEGELVLARVLNPLTDCGDVVTPSLDDATRVVSKRWREELDATLVRQHEHGRAVVAIQRRGEELRDTILSLASEEEADIIAMNSRGSGLIRHALLGSVALGVLGKSTVPVLVVGEHAAPPATGDFNIAVTTDGSRDSERAVEAVSRLAADADVRVTLIRIHEPKVGDRGDLAELQTANEDVSALRQHFQAPETVDTVVRPIVNLGGVDTAIVNVAGEVGASIIAMSTHGHSAAYHLFVGSVALGVLGHSQVPVLLVRSGPAFTRLLGNVPPFLV